VAAAIGSHGGVADHLRSRNSLLVLDNFEQVIEAAPFVGAWIDDCAGLVVLVTSREALRLRAEHEHPLAPLASEAAVALFAARARAVSPGFHANQVELERLCERLDGMPLGPGARGDPDADAHSPSSCSGRLDQRFSLLRRGRPRPTRAAAHDGGDGGVELRPAGWA
jgi:predicted ATPase